MHMYDEKATKKENFSCISRQGQDFFLFKGKKNYTIEMYF